MSKDTWKLTFDSEANRIKDRVIIFNDLHAVFEYLEAWGDQWGWDFETGLSGRVNKFVIERVKK